MKTHVSAHRSGCPINLALEVLGDKWTLLIIRDLMFGNRRHFRELLSCEEGIASNILADRLRRLVDAGMLTRADDPTHKQRGIYSLTEKAIQLVPVLAQVGAWGRRHFPVSEELGIRAELLEKGGARLWDAYMDELRERHLGKARPSNHRPPASAQLQEAYEAAIAHARR